MTKHIKTGIGSKTIHVGNKAPCPVCGGRMYRLGGLGGKLGAAYKGKAELVCRKCRTHGLKKDYGKAKKR